MSGPVHKKTLYVGGLTEAVTVPVLTAAFIPFGDLIDVQVAECTSRLFLLSFVSPCCQLIRRSPFSLRVRVIASNNSHTQIPVDTKTSTHRGFGFVEFDLKEDAMCALDNMNGAELFGRTLKVSIAKPQLLPKNRAVWCAPQRRCLLSCCCFVRVR